MLLSKNISLKPYNTFGIDVEAALFMEWNSVKDVIDYVADADLKLQQRLILGGGSNLLLTSNFDGVAIKNNILGKEVISESVDEVILKVGGGEVWHQTVLWTINKGWNGMENMSLIPGSIGAAPIQNIGAYGKELKDIFVSLEAVNLFTGELEVFDLEACQFGYRDSVFKNKYKDQFVIVSVTIRLKKKDDFNISYGSIPQELEIAGVKKITAKAISNAVITIRESKLPDPSKLGNSGSFFKNPLIAESLYDEVKYEHPMLPGYPAGDGIVKVPAGWLVDQAGWKGKRVRRGYWSRNFPIIRRYYCGRDSEIWY